MSARPGLCGGHRATGVPTAISTTREKTNRRTKLRRHRTTRLKISSHSAGRGGSGFGLAAEQNKLMGEAITKALRVILVAAQVTATTTSFQKNVFLFDQQDSIYSATILPCPILVVAGVDILG